MSKKQMNAITVLVLSFIIIFGNVVPIQAAIPSISTSNYIKAYVLSTGNNTPVYTDSSLWVRGTASPYKKYSATVYASDEIYIYSMTSDYAYISYPTSSGRRKGYIRTSSITSNNKSVGALNSRAKIATYKRAGGAVYGNIDAGDKVYTLAASGSYIQVVYPIGRGYKMGWITSTDYNNYIANSLNNTNTIADGYYQIKSAANTNYVLDISGASTYEGASALIWQNGNANNTTEMNQKFKIEKASGNYYYIKYAKSNQCLDVYNGEMSNETDIIQWPHHGADNQLWQIEKTADGYYTIKSKLNGLYMDVYKCDMSNGTNVQCYQWNGGMNQKWVLSPAIVNGVTINNNNFSNTKGQQLADSIKSRVENSYPNGYCLKFVEECYQKAGGVRPYHCCASHSGDVYIQSSGKNDIPIGATVYFGNCGGGSCRKCGNRYYGHVGIYVGNGEFVHATGGEIQKSSMMNGYWSQKYRGYGFLGGFNVN